MANAIKKSGRSKIVKTLPPLTIVETQTLLKLNKAIAITQDKVELLKVINEEVKKVIPFDAPGLFIVNEAENYHYDLTVVHPDMNNDDLNTGLVKTIENRIPHSGSAIEVVMKSDTSRLWHWKNDLMDKGFTHPYFPSMLENKLFYAIACPLKVRGKILGFFSVSSVEDVYIEDQLPLFAAITDAIAIAVSNIITNEEILVREKEKTILLSISEDIAAVRNKEELLKIVVHKIKPLFGFYDCGILIIDRNNKYHDLAAIYPEIDGSEVNRQLNEQNFYKNSGIPYAGSGVEWMITEIEKQKRPIVFNYTKDYSAFSDGYLLQLLKDGGYKEALAGLLKAGGKIYGCFTINFNTYGRIKALRIPLFQNVTEQLSVAVSNILANEEILKREKEKSQLLEITELIASVKSTPDLLRIVIEKIKPLFDFHDCGLFVLSADGTTHSDWAAVLPGVSPSDWNDLIATVSESIPHKNSPVEWAMNVIDKDNTPVLFDFEDFVERFPTYPQIAGTGLLEMGYRDCLGVNLKSRSKSIGWFCINALQKNFFKPAQYALFQSVSHSISIAIANILANEEIVRREKEKSILLSISEAIATIRDKKDLLKLVFEKVKPLFNFYDTGFFVFDEKHRVIEDWSIIIDEVSPSKSNTQLKEIEAGTMPYNTPVMHWALSELNTTKGPIVFSYTDELINRFPDYPQFKTLRDFGIKESLSAVLRSDKKDFGILFFNSKTEGHFKPEQFKLFQSIADQLAVAVANILASEEIAEREKTKSLQIEMGKALAEEAGWNKRLLRCATLLQKEIPYTLLLATIMMDDNHFITYGFYLTGKNEYQVLEQDDLQRIVGTKGEEFYNHWQELSKEITAPFISSASDERNILTKHTIRKKLMEHFKLGHSMVYPIMLSNFKMVHFLFYTNTNQPYVQKHINFMNNIQNYTSICFDRVLAYDELEKLSRKIEQENKYLQEEIKSEYNFDSIIGNSRVLKEVFRNVRLVATADTTVLILGETGTGKELIARSLHNSSPRNQNTFIKINCAALPAQLIESELFGHEKGSFTGAFEKRIGKFELADGGSIFLDEIGELPLELQSKLLRVLQEKEFERIGGSKVIKCDVRIIAATNRVLEKEVEKGKFRSDLYYRLNVFPIHLPPLRERKEDVPLLATYFAQKFCKKMNRPFKGINSKMLEALTQYEWPGNIRELENVMEQAVIVNQGTDGLELARQLLFAKQPTEENIELLENKQPDKYIINVKQQKETMEKEAISVALQKTNGRIRGEHGAAVLLGLLPTTLESKMKKYGISKYAFEKLGYKNG